VKSILNEKLKDFDENQKKEFLKEFDEVMWNKKHTPTLAKREIDKIILYHNKDNLNQVSFDKQLRGLASGSISNKKTSETRETTTLTKEALLNAWFSENYAKDLYPELF
jgi:uncharacterized protein YdaT